MKTLTGILTAVTLCLLFAASPAYSQSAGKTKVNTVQGRNYTDKNIDGVCDNRTANVNGRNNNYVDANKNGVCDNRENGTSGKQNGTCRGGKGKHRRGGR